MNYCLTYITLVCLLGCVLGDLDYQCQRIKPRLWGKTMVYSGYMPTKDTNRGNTALDFVFVGCQKAGTNEAAFQYCPTIFWFQGGPCETSFWGNFFGIGPYIGTSTSPFSFQQNPYSWNKNYNLVFVDQPLGAGFSQYDNEGDQPKTVGQAANQLYIAMNEMFTNKNLCVQKFNLKRSSIYLFGQEEAGQMLPELMGIIKVKENKDIKIRGLGLGNAFTDPDNILAYIGMYAYNNGLIEFNERQIIEKYIMSGIVASRTNNWQTVRDMYNLVVEKVTEYSGIPDPNNIRRNYEVDYKFNMIQYFQGTQQRVAWGFNSTEDFDVFNLNCMQKLEESTMIYDENTLENILIDYPILFFNGQYDLEICTICTENWLNQLHYQNQDAFQKAEFTALMASDGKSYYAYQKMAGNLEYMIIKGAGQMVAYDQPAYAFQMVNEFVRRHP